MKWYWVISLVLGFAGVWLIFSFFCYKLFFKRVYDVLISGISIIVLLPLFVFLTVVGAIAMQGNPFFIQLRPGKINSKTGKEKIFKMLKFRTMSKQTDNSGNLLPDSQRLNRYGKLLRATSLDELPELFNIFIGNMSLIGPRPLLVEYLPRYNEEQRHRHDVLPGLTGWAQCHGRNSLSWEERFALDKWYVDNYSFSTDFQIIIKTIGCVIRHDGINSENSATMEDFLGEN